ncbi:MAG: MFS transporter [Vicinamibacterales bacterium]
MLPSLVTPRFLVMCGFSFVVFLSAFQLFPTAPFHILDLGGGDAASGLFLGFLTYASAFSAPATGALADRVGFTRVMVVSSVALCAFSIVYAVLPGYKLMLALAVVHGMFWSGLLTASAAYLTNMLPVDRRAEGIGYYGLASVAAIAVAPPIGFWVYRFGWRALCLESAALNATMAVVAWRIAGTQAPDAVRVSERRTSQPAPGTPRFAPRAPHSALRAPHSAPRSRPAAPRPRVVEWRVLVLALSLFLCTFGYGGITSFTALYADASGVSPKGIYLTLLAVVILTTRPLAGRLGDRLGYRRIYLPCLALIAVGLWCLTRGGTLFWQATSAVIFGAGFGTAYPVFVGYVMRHVDADRRGAAFGAILAAFDTGIGTGSTSMGWIIGRYGFATAFGVAAALSTLAIPYFLIAERSFAKTAAGISRDREIGK